MSSNPTAKEEATTFLTSKFSKSSPSATQKKGRNISWWKKLTQNHTKIISSMDRILNKSTVITKSRTMEPSTVKKIN